MSKTKEEKLQLAREYYHKNRKRINDRRNLPEQKQARRLRVNKRRNKVRREMLNLLGGKCSKCGFTDWRALQVDHPNGGGCEERKQIPDTWAFMRHVIKNLDNYQILCANCNWIKRYERYENRRNDFKTYYEKPRG